ncbi:hypothetical protein [Pseudoalteromonas sp. T1lg24]|uniref:hypothetical protein n=1 Tax=Pseudoalteromonas sp. T1lg24 TaxID=2077099 RepID=UPI000CF5F536|nr:hypothetical protein [Pseudoalteromonas sp. T1lg24]
MGYRVSSLNKIPKVPGIEFYLYVVGDISWKTGFTKALMDNFDTLAKQLGEKGAVIALHEGMDLTEDLSECVNALAYKNNDIRDMLSTGKGLGLLFTSAHPNDLTAKDIILYSPVEMIDKHFNTLEQFFGELCAYVENGDTDFINKFTESRSGMVAETVELIDLNPNFFGIGVNLNPLKSKAVGWMKSGYNKALKRN